MIMKLFTALDLPAALIAAGTLASASIPPAPRNAPSAANNQHLPSTSHGPNYNSTPHFSFEELFQLQKKFLDNFVFPENQVQVNT